MIAHQTPSTETKDVTEVLSNGPMTTSLLTELNPQLPIHTEVFKEPVLPALLKQPINHSQAILRSDKETVPNSLMPSNNNQSQLPLMPQVLPSNSIPVVSIRTAKLTLTTLSS